MRYWRDWLGGDVAAGFSVAAIALPVGVAYADIVGVPPQMGLYAAIFPMLAYAVLGSSRHLVIGPDAATCILLAAAVAPLSGGDPARHVALAATPIRRFETLDDAVEVFRTTRPPSGVGADHTEPQSLKEG